MQHFYYFFSDIVLFFVLDKIFLYLLSFHLVLFSLAFKLVVLVKINLFLVSVANQVDFSLRYLEFLRDSDFFLMTHYKKKGKLNS